MVITRDTINRAIRTFVVAFLGIALPGFLGFLHDVTGWANSNGQAAFPNAHNLSFILVAGLSAGMIAVLNVVVGILEDWTGKSLVGPRKGASPPPPPPA